MSTDPAIQEYFPGATEPDNKAKTDGSLPGTDLPARGLFNNVNLQLYHYAGNNPIKYSDPSGEFAHAIPFLGALAKGAIVAAAAAATVIAAVSSPVVIAAVAVVAVATIAVVGGAMIMDAMENKKAESASVAVAATATATDEDKGRIYYRGLSNADMNDIATTGGINSNAVRDGSDITPDSLSEEAMANHAGTSHGSAFVSVTSSRRVAKEFAEEGSDPSGYVATIRTNRAIANPANTGERESLVPISILPHEIIAVEPVN